MEFIEIFPKIKVLNSFKGVYFEQIDSFAISDLQIGYELYLAEEKGIFLPQIQLKEIKKEIGNILQKIKIKKLIINGDFKHEFGEASKQEWREVKEFVNFVRKKVKEIVLVRGNHDNYLLSIASHLGLKVFDPYYFEKGILFAHGHKKIDYPKNVETIVIGHEQPALLFKRGFDKIKVACLLYGKTKDGKKFICLPAFSPLASGVEINAIQKEELLSPILRDEVELEELRAIAIDKEIGCLKFPKIKKIKINL